MIEIGKLNIKLKHVDIHNTNYVKNIESIVLLFAMLSQKKRIVDGLKTLSLDDHRRFLNQLDLIDIRDRLIDRRNQEAAFKPSNLINID